MKPSVAWVTGGGSGIGRALALRLVREGYAVAISGRRKEALRETVAAAVTQTPQAQLLIVTGDVTDDAFVTAAVARITAELGPIDLLVNNAGVNSYHSWDETAFDEFKTLFDVNTLGPIRTIRAALPGMLDRGRGTLVIVSSVLGKWASAGSAAYSVSKYAATGLIDVLRQHLIHTPVQVLGVYPGFIRTAMTEPFVEPGTLKSKIGETPEAMAEAIWRAIQRRAPELHFPKYVSWVIRLHRWAPRLADRMARKVRR
jgi:NAD(P)-dependent dehydrogenase (short-subunit alcohol dehydrogenase family)